MKGILGVFIVVFLLAVNVQAFLSETHKFICEEVVRRIWGADVVVNCFEGREPFEWNIFCEETMPSLEYVFSCMNYSRVFHPSVLADTIFNDTHTHVDYALCPITSTLDAKHLCVDRDLRLSIYFALSWFNKSANSKSLCQRVYAFCVASNYFSDGFLPTNRFVGGYGTECARDIEEGVEKKITGKDSVWEVNTQCKIEYLRGLVGQNLTATAKQEFRVTSGGVEMIINELTAYGLNISLSPYVTTTSTSSTTTSSSTTSTTSSTTSTTLTKVVEVEEEGESILGKVLKALVFIVIVLAVFLYLKKTKKGGRKRPHTLLSSSEHTHPTHLESV